MKFIFNGDRLSYVDIRVTDMATSVQTSVYSVSEDDSGGHLPIYNGEEFTTTTNVPYLQNGHDYVWQVMLAQRNLSGADNLYDIPVCRGTVPFKTGGDTPSTILFVDSNLPIYEWGYNGNDETSYPTIKNDTVCAGMVIEVNGERRFIQSYKPRLSYNSKIYGQITLDSPFSSNPEGGDRYQIMSNYLISPQYYFMSRALPTLNMSIDYTRQEGFGSRQIHHGSESGVFNHSQDHFKSFSDCGILPALSYYCRIRHINTGFTRSGCSDCLCMLHTARGNNLLAVPDCFFRCQTMGILQIHVPCHYLCFLVDIFCGNHPSEHAVHKKDWR